MNVKTWKWAGKLPHMLLIEPIRILLQIQVPLGNFHPYLKVLEKKVKIHAYSWYFFFNFFSIPNVVGS
jgi:hypothetical protein